MPQPLLVRFLFVAVCLAGTGCSRFASPPDPAKDPARAWSYVLSEHVDDEGRIDFTGISSDRAHLEAFVSYIARTVPESFPEGNERIAFHINSYNALTMYGVLKSGLSDALADSSKRTNFYNFSEYMIGGRSLSLAEYEKTVLLESGDPRVRFAVNGISESGPRLRQEPFSPADLAEQLDSATREFFNDEKYVRVSPEASEVKVSEYLKPRVDDGARSSDASSLIEYANRHREEKIPPDYTVHFVPFDWTLKKQTD